MAGASDDRLDSAGRGRGEDVFHLHRFDDTDRLPRSHERALGNVQRNERSAHR